MLKRQRPSGRRQQGAARPQVVQQQVAQRQAPEQLARLVLVQRAPPALALEPAPWVLAQQPVLVLARRAQACSAQVLVVARWPVPAQQLPTQPWPRMAVACWPPKVRRYRAR